MFCNKEGFSLIEVLVSLVVISLTALNLAVIQKKVSDQQRDNITHSYVISLATEKMEEVLSMTSVADLIAKDSTAETGFVVGHTSFNILWRVDTYSSPINVGIDLKEVAMDISWIDATGNTQYFTYSRYVNLALILSGASGDKNSNQSAAIIASELATTEVLYFEPHTGYKEGAFVIHNSYLYEATSDHSGGNGYPRIITDSSSGNQTTSDGWLSYGRIDNPDLVNNSDLSTLFLE